MSCGCTSECACHAKPPSRTEQWAEGLFGSQRGDEVRPEVDLDAFLRLHKQRPYTYDQLAHFAAGWEAMFRYLKQDYHK